VRHIYHRQADTVLINNTMVCPWNDFENIDESRYATRETPCFKFWSMFWCLEGMLSAAVLGGVMCVYKEVHALGTYLTYIHPGGCLIRQDGTIQYPQWDEESETWVG